MKTAVITGAASGLGKALAHYYSKQKWQVIIADIQQQAGQDVADEINKSGGTAYFSYCILPTPSFIIIKNIMVLM